MRKIQLSALITLTALTLVSCGNEGKSSTPTSTTTFTSENPTKAGRISATPNSKTARDDDDRNDESRAEITASTPGDVIADPANDGTSGGTDQNPGQAAPPAPAADPGEDDDAVTAPADPVTPPVTTPDPTGTATSFTPCDSEGATAVQPGEINNTDLVCVADGEGGLQWEPR